MFSKQYVKNSKLALQQKVDNIDRILLSLNTIEQTNRNYRSEIQQIRDNINSQTIKLKEIIEKKSKELISKLMGVEANFNRKLIDIDSYKSSLSDERASLKNIIKDGSDYLITNAKLYRFQTDALILKHKKLIQIKCPIFTMPLIDAESLQAKDLFGSIQNIQIDGMINLVKSVSDSISICAMKHYLYMLNYPNIYVYDMHLNNFKTSIDLKINKEENSTAYQIIGISNFLFILFDMINADVEKSIIYKFDLQNYICLEWKTMNPCRISSTNHATILATTGKRELIEFSLDGLQLKLINYSVEGTRYFGSSYQLVDGRYVAKEQDEQLCYLYLIDSEGNVIKSNSIKHSGYSTMCTDYDKYIFVCDNDTSIISVLSTNLHRIREFYFTNVFRIIYDRENKRILGRKVKEILYFNYNEESIKDI